MRWMPWSKSVVTRLVVAFWIGGVALALALGAFEQHRSRRLTELTTSQQLILAAHNMQHMLRPLLHAPDDAPLLGVMAVFRHDPRIISARLSTADGRTVTSGPWVSDTSALALWAPNDHVGRSEGRLDLERRTLMLTTFSDAGRTYTLQMLIDTPLIAQQMRGYGMDQLSRIGVLLGVLTLAGLLLLRRWLAAPLNRIVTLTRTQAPAAAFDAAARSMHDEFGDLAGSLGRMLHHLDETTAQLRDRKQAFEHLYQFAPAALLSIDPAGRIVEANRRAAELFGRADQTAMIGLEMLALVRSEDRARFRQCIDRVELDQTPHADLRIDAIGSVREVAAELAPVHNPAGELERIRVALVDITQARALMRQVEEQRRLLDLVINHMSDAILLLSDTGEVMAVNQRLTTLLRLRPEEVLGQPYDPATLWSRLSLVNPGAFEQRMTQAVQRLEQPAQEQFETRDGSFLFNVVPVHDELRRTVGQLWVVQEVSAQVRSRRLLEQQDAQLHALRRIGRRLQQVDTLDELMEKVMADLHGIFEVEAIGMALRCDHPQRVKQLLWTGDACSTVGESETVLKAITDELMPRVLPNRATSFFTDLAQHAEWSAPLTGCGFEALAATALCSRDKTQGVLWIARRGGNRIESHHLHLLEAIAPLLATALDNAALRDQLRQHQLTDAVTDLPSRRQLAPMIARLVNRPGHPWSLLVLDLDHFKRVNDTLGHGEADALLRRLAALLRDACRSTDQIVRYDNDRFVIVCADSDVHGAAQFAERLRVSIAQFAHTDGHGRPVRLTCTIGVAGSPNDHHGKDLTLDVALRRLDDAKAAGRNRVNAGDHSPTQRAATSRAVPSA